MDTTSKNLTKPKISSVSDTAILFEVCVDSIESAVNAIKGGADRLELCSALSTGGLTPSTSLLREVKKIAENKPVFVMIRLRDGDYCYTDKEIEIMKMELIDLKSCGADGFVFGLLKQDGTIDAKGCSHLLSMAFPLPCTFHKAFDVADVDIQTLVELGFKRVLTSGKRKTTTKGITEIKTLITHSGGKIIVLPGGGITKNNICMIINKTGAKEIHGSFSLAKQSDMLNKAADFSSDFGQDGYFTRKVTSHELLREAKLLVQKSINHSC